MRYQDQQYDDTHPDVVKSDPVPVPPANRDEPVDEDLDHDRREETTYDRRTDDDRVADESGVDRGTFDDPVTVDERADADRGDVGGPGAAIDASTVDDARDDSGFGHADADRDLAAAGPVGTEDIRDADLDRDRDVSGVEDTRDADLQQDLDRELGGAEDTRDADLDRSDYDRDHVTEPAPQPTAFGGATVGGAAAAAAMAGQGRAEPHDVRDEDTVRRGDGSVDDQLAYADTTTDDRYADTTQPTGDRDVDADQRALNDQPGFDHVDPLAAGTTGSAVGTPATSPDSTVDGQPVGEVAPAGQLMPGDVPAEPVAALLSAEAGQNFQDRWREVQLRFVDDPRAAAGEAQRLVEEAVESLARALAEQKDKLGGWDSGDTENLRVAVRRYRDFLDRVLGL